MISYKELQKLSKQGNVIPLFEKIPADLDTPVSAFIKLGSTKKQGFLLESIEGGEKLARYSFLGFDPYMIIENTNGVTSLTNGKRKKKIKDKPIEFVREIFSRFKPIDVRGLPRFTGGAVGYFGYDTVRWVENIPDNNKAAIGLPDMRLCFYRNIIAFDHLKQEIIIISNIIADDPSNPLKKQYDSSTKWLKLAVTKLSKPISAKNRTAVKSTKPKITAHNTQKQFEEIVKKAKRYIKEGDVYQVVLSQRWHINSKLPALDVYRRLRRINPSPYMFLLIFGKNAIVGASPEMMVRIEKDVIETRPIAGTRPRGETDEDDARLVKELLDDEKEIAEHTMLLDLGRNDVGRVSETGSVRVKDNMIIEKYSHVIHIVSSVVGRMNRNNQPIDGHFACFPAGTVSGAPKIRAMQIIDELETERRGIYAGSIAYLDFWGNLDSCIAIRTIVKKGNKYYIQAGAGIVADSQPTREFNETKAKAYAAIQAITGEEK